MMPGSVHGLMLLPMRSLFRFPAHSTASHNVAHHGAESRMFHSLIRDQVRFVKDVLVKRHESIKMKNHPAQHLWKRLKHECNEKVVLLGEILTTQCNFYASQRLWRASQVWSLYTKIYSEKCFQQMVLRFISRLQNSQRPRLSLLLGATLFCWDKGRITDEEICCCVDELDKFEEVSPNGSMKLTYNTENPFAKKLEQDGWEPIITQECFHVWRKQVPGTSLCEYKVLGTFTDIPARVFFNVQMDIEYRKVWDHLVIELNVIDKDDKEDGCEVIHWVMHYPFPMYSRDYVYIRRGVVDTERNAMVIVSRAVDHPSCPESPNYVRVTDYSSKMVIRPHKSFDDNGFDYLLTYFDDPRAAFPSPAYNWMASSGVPEFVQKLHKAACDLHYGNLRSKQQQIYPQSTTSCTSTANQCIYA